MIKRTIFFMLGIFLLASAGNAQNMSWKKHKKLAEQLYAQGDYAGAADNYEKAWQKKNSKKELIFKAGESYYLIKDYRKAAEALQNVKDENEEFQLPGLKYARSLKQDGQYKKAGEAFQHFLDNYTGQGKAILEDIIQTEIQGCELGKELPARANRDVEIQLLGGGVNSDEDEFAPFPLGGGGIYFSSSMGGKARIYTSQRQGNNWSKAATPGNFPVISQGHFCNGSASPDGNRFYFTICNADKGWNDLTARCEIFVIKKSGNAWSQPERLPDYINMKGVTATHPFPVHIGGQEFLYFASSRTGGRGGMDIWYVTRDLGIDNNDFTFPVNLGPSVNTLGDEITPYYDQTEGALYFASNGLISIGGFDVFSSRGTEVNWSVPENVGLPYNSSADDYFFIKNNDAAGGFLVSNRVFGGEKNSTRHADIFEYTIGGPRIMVKGNVYDQISGNPAKNIAVSLYRVMDDGALNLLIQRDFANGTYSFDLMPNQKFRLEVDCNGYTQGAYQFVTDDPNTSTYGQPIFLEKSSFISNDTKPNVGDTRPPVSNVQDDFSSDNNIGGSLPLLDGSSTGVSYTSRGSSPKDNYEYVSSAPRYKGVYFKVQLIALKRFDSGNSKFQPLQNLGRFDTEEIVARQLTRVLLGDYFSQSDAESALNQVQQSGFPNAYIVRYEDGVRYGKVRFE